MNAVRQSCRPKHQVLVLKCYPRFTKSQTSVRPNGSELSYLLYYASTRRSKLPKLGAFLEKRTVSDVWHQRIGNVQVTLQIVAALIEKCGRDLPLFAENVLAILRAVLASGDVTMVEATTEVWEEFCRAQDPAVLAANPDYVRLYDEVVQSYVHFASKDKPFQVKGQITVPTSVRFRKVGLSAINSMAENQALNAESARQLNLAVPVILENLYSKDPLYLQILQQREFNKEQIEKEAALKRRQSIAAVRDEVEGEADPLAALGTTEQGDVYAEQDVAIEAMQALRTYFSGNNRGLLRLVTSAVLKFVMARVKPQDQVAPSPEYHTREHGTWPTNLFGLLCYWTPVQDRYVVLVTAMETLVRSPIVEDDLERQHVLAQLVGWLLSSNINFIGLSVMDVLVGLMQHVSLLLQLGGPDSDIRPHEQQAIGSDINLATTQPPSQRPGTAHTGVAHEVVQKPSESRVQLLNQLLQCIGNLGTHVYYSDQISDMIVAIMRRLKPGSSSPSATISAIEDPSATVETLARTISVKEKPNTDHFFSFDTSRVAALQAVRSIITVANARAADGTSNASGRSPIGTSVWDGTQWLLRDPSYQVRLAYHDAILTWLELETKRSDLKVKDDAPRRMKSEKKDNASKGESLARRAVSNASPRDRSPGPKRNMFLDLLHLAIYDNAHSFAESERDILLLHSLLSTLTAKLGVNAARSGLPMIMCLQREIPSFESAVARTNVSSLVHGYFWALAVYFDFDASATARTVLNEISRRTQNGTWLQTIRVPPLMPQAAQQAGVPEFALNADGLPARPGTAGTSGTDHMDTGSLKPFDNSAALVDKIAQGYSMSLYSPPTSPPGSPSRSFSVPILAAVGRSRSISSQVGGFNLRALSPSRGPVELPSRIREELTAEWSKDALLANSASENSRSITGSFSASNRNRSAKHLAVTANGNASPALGSSERLQSPRSPQVPLTPTSLAAAQPNAEANRSPAPHSTSSEKSAVRIEDLKRVLAGATAGGGALRTAWSLRGSSTARWNDDGYGDVDNDTASDSMVSADLSAADMEVPQNVAVPLPPGVEMPGEHDEAADEEEVVAAKEDADQEVGGSREMPISNASGHARTTTEDTIRPLVRRPDGTVKGIMDEQGFIIPPPPPPMTADSEAERRGRYPDTDAESSVYATPGESPAPPLSRHASSIYDGPTPGPFGTEQHQSGTETPRASMQQTYFGEALATVAAQALPHSQALDSSIAEQGEPPTPTADRRPASSRRQPGSPTSNRKSTSRNVSYEGQQPYTAAAARPGTATKRPGTGTRSARSSMQRVPTGMSAGSTGSAGSPVDTRSLLESIEVDGWGDKVGRRPPY